jgi:hypothetical protein
MDVDNRGLDDGIGRMDDSDNAFIEGDSGRAQDESDYLDEGMSEADSESDFADEADFANEADECSDEEPVAAAEDATHAEDTASGNDICEIDPSPHSLLSVLFPAKPPRPRNARIVRLFDIEAAKSDPQPGEEPVVEPPKEEPRTREAIRAARNQSLLVAARFR